MILKVVLVAYGLLIMWEALAKLRFWRSADGRARRDLLAAVRVLKRRHVYLARDDHVVLIRNHGFPEWQVLRFPEGDIQVIDREGSGTATWESFRVPHVLITLTAGRVVRLFNGGRFDRGVLGTRLSRLAQVRGMWRNLRMRHTGTLHPDPAELAELTAQIKRAECMGPVQRS